MNSKGIMVSLRKFLLVNHFGYANTFIHEGYNENNVPLYDWIYSHDAGEYAVIDSDIKNGECHINVNYIEFNDNILADGLKIIKNKISYGERIRDNDIELLDRAIKRLKS